DELGGWQKSYDAGIGAKLIAEMVPRDVNHPSILFWDNGNEGGWNNAVNDEFAKWDPQNRNVLHPWELFRGINTKHYPNYSPLTQLAAAPNVFIPTEILHGLFDGGAGAGMHAYWEVIRNSKVGGGFFIWAWVDAGRKRDDQY